MAQPRAPARAAIRSGRPEAATGPRKKFCWPTNAATYADAGRAYTVSASASCSMRPARMIAMRSLIDSASPWSCVTKTKVMPSRDCSSFELELHLFAQLAVERAQRLVQQQHGGPVRRGLARARRAAADRLRAAWACGPRTAASGRDRAPATRAHGSRTSACGAAAAHRRRSRRPTGAGRARTPGKRC